MVFDYSVDETVSPPIAITPTFPTSNVMVWKESGGIVVCGGAVSAADFKVDCVLWEPGAATTTPIGARLFGSSTYTPMFNNMLWVNRKSELNVRVGWRTDFVSRGFFHLF